MPKILVPGEGPPNAKILFVGEAPGRDEITAGRPFVGSAGRIFDRLLLQAGIVRSECRVTNVIKEKPPNTSKKNNDISVFIRRSGKRAITSPEYDKYEADLYQELSETDANVIVPLGWVALYALYRKIEITKWRGSIIEGITGKKTIPTFHPSALQYVGGRQGKKKDKGVDIYAHYNTSIGLDLKRILRESEFPEINHPLLILRTGPSFDEVIDYLHTCSKLDQVAFDIETYNREVSCLSFAISSTDAMSIPFVHNGGMDYFSVEREAEVWRRIAEVLEDDKINKVGQNLTFDISFLHRKMGIVTRNIHDTMVAQGIITPDLPKGLDYIASIYTKIPYYKNEGKTWMKSDRTPDVGKWEYNCKDSIVCMKVIEKQLAQLASQGNLKVYNLHIRSVFPYSYMHVKGLRVDNEMLSEASKTALYKIKSLRVQLNDLCGEEINPNSPPQVMAYFYGKKGLIPYISRKSKNPTTDEEALTRIARRGFKEADVILEIRGLVKLRGTYLDVDLDEDGRLRSSYNTVGTTSGRPSSSKPIVFDTGVDAQNLTPEIKKAIISDPGCIFYDIDLAQAENRVVAYIAQEGNMMRAFENDVDIHTQTASLILGKPFDDITKKERDNIGKPADHGLNYGEGYRLFSLLNMLPEKEGKFIVEQYHSAYPGVRLWHKRIQSKLGTGRKLATPLGRSRLFLGRWGDDLFREAYSFIPQSVVAQVIKERGLLFLYEDQERFGPVEILNDVYDSITIQIPIEAGWEYHADVLSILKENLETPIPHATGTFVIPVEIEMGLNLKDMTEIEEIHSEVLEEVFLKLGGLR